MVTEEDAPPYDPWQARNVRLDFFDSFVDDGYVLTEEIKEKYRASKEAIPFNGGIWPHFLRLFKNVSIFDVTGLKLTWSDISPMAVEKMLGVYYVLSEYRSFWRIPKNAVKIYKLRGSDPNPFSTFSIFEDLLPQGEATLIDIRYMKSTAIARIVDGEIQTSREIFSRNYN